MRPIRHTRLGVVASLAAIGMLWASAIPASGASVGDLETELAAVESQVAGASVRALNAETAAGVARTAADAAAARASTLDGDAAESEAAATAHRLRLGAVAATLAKTSRGPLVAKVLTSADPDDLLSRLGTLERVGRVSARLSGAARASANLTAAQRAQATAAQVESERLAVLAEQAAASARAEVVAESGALAAAQGELDALYAQLAVAERTTVLRAKAERVDRTVADQAASQPAAGVTPPPQSVPPAPPLTPPPVAPPVTPPAGGPLASPAEAQAIARSMLGGRGWGDDQFTCLVRLWNRESGWRVQARNPSSGAYGIPQAYPAEKMAAAGADWRTNAATQIAWGLSYIGARHGSPCGAWDHSERTGWY